MKLLRLAFLLLLVSCAATRPPVLPGTIPAQESSDVSEEDIRYGQQVLQEFKRRYRISKDRQAMLRLRDVVERLADAAQAGSSAWQIYLFEGDKVLNAAATRGNYIFVWTGLLNKANDDAELATVLAHEMGHVLARHTYATPAEQANAAISGIAAATACL